MVSGSGGRATDAETSVEAVFREERGRLLAALVSRFGDLDLAEEATSEAIEAALRRWPVDGVPSKPGAWLLATARRRAVDRLRRDQVLAARIAVLRWRRIAPIPPLLRTWAASCPTSGSSCSSRARTPRCRPRTARR